jgi:cbb3-type cytochrome oxidase cytochrome c subunit
MIPAAAYAQDGSVQQKGITIFVEKRCYTCHTVKAESAQVEAAKEAFAKSKGVELKESEEDKDESKGGDLSNVGADRDAKWLTDFIKNPKDYFKDTPDCKKLAKKKDRKKFKGTDAEFQDLLAWLETLKYGNMQEAGFESCLKE